MQLGTAALFRLQGLVSWFGATSVPMTGPQLCLFGGTSLWITPSVNWTAVDDRVRGGSSQSYFALVPNSTHVCFSGTLDTKTLGGAGFASQTTTGNKVWDLSAYDGIQVEVINGDGKMYTLIIKDEVPQSKRDDGREMSSVSWEYDFKTAESSLGSGQTTKVWVPWSELKATYRGREKKDAEPLKKAEIRRFSLMMRSFFEKQEGDFELVLASISAARKEIVACEH
ncbi:hypothetical protein MMC11_006974 [Xylographa trunciseda]|nr:hypothetical protein [Xylographa trunciseda]